MGQKPKQRHQVFKMQHFAIVLICGALNIFSTSITPVYGADAVISEETSEETPANARIEMKPFSFPVTVRGRQKGSMMLVVVLKLQEGAELEEINTRLPQLRGDILIAGNQLAARRFRPNTPVDPDVVAYYFQNAVDRRLGSGKIRVFINQSVYQSAQ